jgi:CRISPR-associated exonuclease Cas4
MGDTGSPWLFAYVVLIAVFLMMAARFVYYLLPKPVTKRRVSLPGFGWRIVYTDNAPANAERKPDVIYGRLLVSPRLNLRGKPDFIYANGRKLMPVELKSGKAGDGGDPCEGDLMQLVVYFELIQAEYNARPGKGLLVYKDCMFVVRNTGRLRRKLVTQLREMEYLLSHPPDTDSIEGDYIKCRHCPCRGTVCEVEK